MATSHYQLVVKQAEQLSPQEQLRLIQQLAARLSQREPSPAAPRYLVYGEFRNAAGRDFSTEEDFKLAEWHPTEEGHSSLQEPTTSSITPCTLPITH